VVEYQIDDMESVVMEWFFGSDPYAARQTAELDDWLQPNQSPHMWRAKVMVPDIEPGTHTFTITATDIYGRIYTDVKVFEVWAIGM
jgi:hypothetical protein